MREGGGGGGGGHERESSVPQFIYPVMFSKDIVCVRACVCFTTSQPVRLYQGERERGRQAGREKQTENTTIVQPVVQFISWMK